MHFVARFWLVMASDRETLLDIDSSFDSALGFSDESLQGASQLGLWAAKRLRMTLNQFSSFAAVAKHLNMTKASAELRVSQPSLSLQLKQLLRLVKYSDICRELC